MCRGANLGPCVVEGCEQPVPCRDNDGYCNEHDPLNVDWCDCEDDCTCPPPKPSPQVSEVKRLRYDLPQRERAYLAAIKRREALEARLREDDAWLVRARARLADLEAEAGTDRSGGDA